MKGKPMGSSLSTARVLSIRKAPFCNQDAPSTNTDGHVAKHKTGPMKGSAASDSQQCELGFGSASAGSGKALCHLFKSHCRQVLRFVSAIGGLDRDSAEDVTQQTFIRVFNALDRFQNERVWEVWLFRVAKREALRFLRRQKRYTRIPDDFEMKSEQEERLTEALERETLYARIQEASASMESDAVACTAKLYYLSKPRRTTAALAAELGVPDATVRKRLHLYRNRLRAELAGDVRS